MENKYAKKNIVVQFVHENRIGIIMLVCERSFSLIGGDEQNIYTIFFYIFRCDSISR